MLHPRKKIATPEKKDYVVTLSLESKATVGSEFFNDEIPSTCHDCPLYQICMKNLVPGRHYIIKEVNDNVRHECPKNLVSGEMVVVKVKERPLIIANPAGKAFEGLRLTFHGQACPEKSCKYHVVCDPPQELLENGTPVKCVKIIKKIRADCKLDRDLSLMQVSRE
ncbi:MAG TPA: UPF0179 family protein [Candidatus Lokiarchaeia archaeon]|nr:UPF0179 family protein [Candidatus Lokiarchaeia archaeon]